MICMRRVSPAFLGRVEPRQCSTGLSSLTVGIWNKPRRIDAVSAGLPLRQTGADADSGLLSLPMACARCQGQCTLRALPD